MNACLEIRSRFECDCLYICPPTLAHHHAIAPSSSSSRSSSYIFKKQLKHVAKTSSNNLGVDRKDADVP